MVHAVLQLSASGPWEELDRHRYWPRGGKSVGKGDKSPARNPVGCTGLVKMTGFSMLGPQCFKGWPGHGSFKFFHRGPGSSVKYLSSAHLGTVIPSERMGNWDVSRGRNSATFLEAEIVPASNIFFLSSMKVCSVNAPHVIQVGPVLAAQNNSISLSCRWRTQPAKPFLTRVAASC